MRPTLASISDTRSWKPQPSEISVVMAGPENGYLDDALAAVRLHLPEAELILSTWRGARRRNGIADILIESDDPGPIDPQSPIPGCVPPGYGGNINRMLRSTNAGLAAATRPFALKLRSDAVLNGRGFLDWWNVEVRRPAEMRVFGQRVLTLSVATRPAEFGGGAFLFHPSDCVHFGTTDDIRHLWSLPEIDEESPLFFRIANEQAIWLHALKRAPCEVQYLVTGATLDALRMSEVAMVANFLVLEPWQFGVGLPKLRNDVRSGPISAYMWLRDWRECLAAACPTQDQP